MHTSDKKTISIFISHQGCPNDCVFCNQRKITGVQAPQTLDEIKEIIDHSLSTIRSSYVEIAFFGGSFTAIPIQQQRDLLELANFYRKKNQIHEIRISTRPDAIDEQILDFLKKYGVGIIELGVQSTSDEVLLASNRGHDSKCVFDASKLILKNGFKLGLQMMIGLPQDDEQKMMKTVDDIILIKPHFVRIYPVLVIRDTELESLFENKMYAPLDVETAAIYAKRAYCRFRDHLIPVIRIGLQASEHISSEGDVIAGPFHPAFGEMVYSLVLRDVLEEYLGSNQVAKGATITVEVPNSRMSQWIGVSKANLKYFEEKFFVKQKIISCDTNTIKIDKIEIALEKIFI